MFLEMDTCVCILTESFVCVCERERESQVKQGDGVEH